MTPIFVVAETFEKAKYAYHFKILPSLPPEDLINSTPELRFIGPTSFSLMGLRNIKIYVVEGALSLTQIEHLTIAKSRGLEIEKVYI